MGDFTINLTEPLADNDSFELVGAVERHGLVLGAYAAECPNPAYEGKGLYHMFIQIVDWRDEDEPIVVMTFPSNMAAKGVGDAHGHHTHRELSLAWEASKEAFNRDADKNADDVGTFYRSLYFAGAMLITNQIETARAIAAADMLGISVDDMDVQRDILPTSNEGPDLFGDFDLRELFDEEDDGAST